MKTKTKKKRDWSFTAGWQIVGGWVGGKSLTCGGLLIQHCIIDCTTPHTHYNTEHKTNFTLNKAIHNLHTEHRTEHIAAHFSTVVGGKPGPRDRSRLSTIFIQTHFILLLALTSNFESIPANCFWSKKRREQTKQKFWCDEVSQQTTTAAAAFVSLCKKHW